MKKTLIALILAVVFVLSFALCVSAAEESESTPTDTEGNIIFGDVNDDGLITNADVLMIYRYIYNSELYPLDTALADVNSDGTITNADVLKIYRYIYNPELYPLPIGCKHSYEDTVVPPTKTDKGYTEHVCKNCGDSYIDTYVPALGSIGLKFTSNGNGTCYVSGIGTCTDTDVVIPSVSPDGDSVTSIVYRAFYGCTSLTSITIGNSVKSIGNYAFEKCTSLTSISIPDSVTSIGNDAFYGCYKLIEVINKSSLSITAGSSSNGYVAYYAKEVHDGSSKIVEKDGWLFYTDNNVNYLVGYKGNETEIILPDNYNGEKYEIYKYAFYKCTSLTSVTIGNSVTSIGSYAFSGCTSLKDVYISDIEAWLNISFGGSSSNPCNYGANLYLNGELLTSVDIPDSISKIEYAFCGCTSLESVIIPDSVTSIGEAAFYGCTSLTSVTIPDSVTSIGSSAFSGCYKLIEVINKSSLSITAGSSSNGHVAYYAKEVHDGSSKIVEKDGWLFYTYNNVNYLFGYKGNETEIILPNSYNGEKYEIYMYAFYKCTSLASIEIPDSVTSIGNGAFYKCTSLTSIEIPDSVTSIGNSAFNNCTSLTSIEIPDSVTSIGDYAFSWCTSLTSVTIGNSVTSIGNYAFEYCTSLTSVTIPDSVTSIGERAFYNCTSLKDVYYTGTQEQWQKISISSSGNSYLTSATIHYNHVVS